MKKNVPYQILVERLHQCYWPSWLSEHYNGFNPRRTKPIAYIEELRRDKVRNYDRRRVRFFLDEIAAGRKLAPIDVESRVYGYQSITAPPAWGPPEVVDGHHRYVAAVLAGLKKIPANFGGLTSSIEWLIGKRDTVPDEIG